MLYNKGYTNIQYICYITHLNIPKLPRSIIGNNGPIISYYRPTNKGCLVQVGNGIPTGGVLVV